MPQEVAERDFVRAIHESPRPVPERKTARMDTILYDVVLADS